MWSAGSQRGEAGPWSAIVIQYSELNDQYNNVLLKRMWWFLPFSGFSGGFYPYYDGTIPITIALVESIKVFPKSGEKVTHVKNRRRSYVVEFQLFLVLDLQLSTSRLVD